MCVTETPVLPQYTYMRVSILEVCHTPAISRQRQILHAARANGASLTNALYNETAVSVMEAIWRCPRFEQIVHLWNMCPKCGARPSIKEKLRVMIRRQRLVSVGPAVMVYRPGEGGAWGSWRGR